MRKKQKIIIVVCAVLALLAFSIKTFFYDNTRMLYSLLEGADEPSSIYYMISERLFLLSTNANELERILNEIEVGENKHLHELYVRTLGVVGDNSADANYALIKLYAANQRDKEKAGILYSVIDGMGFIGDESSIAVLNRLLYNYDKHLTPIAKYPIARAFYLSTGDLHQATKGNSNFTITAEIQIVRKIILNSKGRYRTIEEMLAIDNLNRPDKFKKP